MTFSHKLLRDHIFDSLREAIIRGEMEPGQRMVELQIAQRFDTSQGPVREALQRLATEGLVELKRHRGTYVSKVNQHEMRAIFEVRKTVERVAVRETVRSITDEQLETVYKVLSEMHAAAERGDFRGIVAQDVKLHGHICACSGQQTLLRVWNILSSQVERFVTMTHPKYFPNLHELVATHRPLVRALEDRDPDKAETAFVEHIDLIWSRIESRDAVGTRDGRGH